MNKRILVLVLISMALASCGGQANQASTKTTGNNNGGTTTHSSTYIPPKTKDDVISFIKNSGEKSGDTYQYSIVSSEGSNKSTTYLSYNSSSLAFGVRFVYFFQMTSTVSRTWKMGSYFQWGSIVQTQLDGAQLTDSQPVMTASTDFWFHDCTFTSVGTIASWEAQITHNVWSYSQSQLQTICETFVFYYSGALGTINSELKKRSLPSLC
jgi:hypothetical protein